ncbi:hypothetical protein [Candidatus Viridilinea mediisalina]|nr:hypothetical protein [Candidatus Viridilinea mediisalina]
MALSLRRRFVLYVSGTQQQADAHTGTAAALLERLGVARLTNAYGASEGWKQNLIRTEHGFSLLSIGLDSNVRGMKLDELRPDLIILDDVDDRHDSPAITAKKLALITRSILPSGAADCAVLFIQNRIHRNSCIAQVADGRAEALLRREISEEPAVLDLCYERRLTEEGVRYRIVGGVPTWPEGQGLAVCEGQINAWGVWAFLGESQHDDSEGDGLLSLADHIDPFRVALAPRLVRIAIGIDPSGADGANGTEIGIVAVGMDARGHRYLLDDSSLAGSPETWARQAVAAYHRLKADRLVAEKNYGGDMVRAVIHAVPGAPPVQLVSASRGKEIRAEPTVRRYEEYQFHHVGTFPALERELTSWRPGRLSPNRLDALVWADSALTLPPPERPPSMSFWSVG